MPLQDAANLLVDVRIVRYKDFDRMLIGLGGADAGRSIDCLVPCITWVMRESG